MTAQEVCNILHFIFLTWELLSLLILLHHVWGGIMLTTYIFHWFSVQFETEILCFVFENNSYYAHILWFIKLHLNLHFNLQVCCSTVTIWHCAHILTCFNFRLKHNHKCIDTEYHQCACPVYLFLHNTTKSSIFSVIGGNELYPYFIMFSGLSPPSFKSHPKKFSWVICWAC